MGSNELETSEGIMKHAVFIIPSSSNFLHSIREAKYKALENVHTIKIPLSAGEYFNLCFHQLKKARYDISLNNILKRRPK